MTESGKKSSALFQKALYLLDWLWKPLWGLWSIVFVGGVVNIGTSWLITQTRSFTLDGTPLGWLITHLDITLPPLASLVLLTILAGYAHRHIISQKVTSISHHQLLRPRNEHTARQDLLKRMRAVWITNFLEKSLHHSAKLDLQLQDRPDALENPWQFLVQELDQTPRSLPTSMNISQIYDEAQGKLLILGEPGAGKTTLLLQLTQTLLARAENDEQQLLPVIFQLSAWTSARRITEKTDLSFTGWLIDELEKRYDVPQMVAKHWVENYKLVLLLDGLDEVHIEARIACVEAIIAYNNDPLRLGTTRLVICCRSHEFEELARPLPLFTAVDILPLSNEQVDMYISSVQGQLDGLRHLIRNDAEFSELIRCPLVLSIATLAFQGKRVINFPSANNFPSEDNFPVGASQDQLLRILFTAYVERMLSRRRQLPSWIQPASFLSWLGVLARQLKQRQQTEFSLDTLQPDWLPHKQRFLYRESLRLGGALLFGLLFSLFGVPIGIPLPSLLLGLLLGALLAQDTNVQSPEIFITSNEDALATLVLGLFVGVFIGLFGLFGGLFGFLIGLLSGLFSGILGVLTTAALLFEEKGIESAYSQIFSATSDRIGNVLQLALNEQL